MQVNTYIKTLENDDDIKDDVIDYLNRHNINDINNELINNLNYIYINDEIKGTISYEKYGVFGLIRAFIYSKDIDMSIIRKLFNNLISICKNKGIKSLIAFIEEKEKKLFVYLGFNHIEEENVFIEEKGFLNSEFCDYFTYLYNI